MTNSNEYLIDNTKDSLNSMINITHRLSDLDTSINNITSLTSQEQSNLTGIISESLAELSNLQNSNFDILNNYKDFVAQNLVNQEITNMYAKNQSENINKMNDAIDLDNNDKLRMVEINDYYIKKNEYLSHVMRIVLLAFGILLIIIVLAKKEILPGNLAIFFGIIVVIAIIGYGIYVTYDLSMRDKLNFDEYIIPFDLTARMKEASGNMISIGQELKTELHPFITGSKGLENVFGCIGESCCSTGTIYDVNIGQCRDITCEANAKYVITNDGSYNCVACPAGYNQSTNECI